MYEVYIRAKTSDDRWATVNAVDLDELSFKRMILNGLVYAGLFTGIEADEEVELRTPLTKEEAEADL